jgi:hypothetical protein
MEELGMGPNGGLIYCMEYPIVCSHAVFPVDCCLPSKLFSSQATETIMAVVVSLRDP